jgi:hypothetical protein
MPERPHPPDLLRNSHRPDARALLRKPLAPKSRWGSECLFPLGLRSLPDVILLLSAEMLDRVPISQEIRAAWLGEPSPPGGSVRTRAGPRNRKTGSAMHERQLPPPMDGPSTGRKTPAKPDAAALPGTFYTTFSSQVTQGTCAKSPVVSNIRLFPMATLPCWPFRAQAASALD